MHSRSFRVGLLAAVVFLLVPAISHAQASGPRRVQSAQFKFWGALAGVTPPEFSTSVPPDDGGTGGSVAYSKVVTVPPDSNTLLVNVSATADLDITTNSLWETVLQDSVPCINGSSSRPELLSPGDETGWVNLQELTAGAVPNDFSDQSISYQWCCHTTPGSHTVSVKFGTGTSGTSVFVEQMIVDIDTAGVAAANACTGT